MNVKEMEERIRAKVLVGASYCPLGSQIRWLDRKMRGWVGGTTGFIDLDSFVDHCLFDLTLVGCREVVIELFHKHKEYDGEEYDLLDVGKFARTVMTSSVQQENDQLRRSVGAIY